MSIALGNVEGSLREALYDTLNGILSPHPETRQAAEQRIQALEATEEFGLHLTQLVVDPHSQLPIRQQASVILEQYVETHWCSLARTFKPPEIKLHTKEKIKELLPLGLRESISKVRTAVAYTISTIAFWDWPENWPGLFDILVNCLSGESEFAVHGAVRVLATLTKEKLSGIQLPKIRPVILQEMCRIFQGENSLLAKTLLDSAKVYQAKTVNGGGDIDSKDIIDSGGKIINFNYDELIIAIFELIHALVKNQRFSTLLDNSLPEVLFSLIIFMEITDEQIELWTNNAIQFVEEKRQYVFAYDFRISAQDLLVAIVNHSKKAAANALCDVIMKQIEAGNGMRVSGNESLSQNWWKLHEASILAFGLAKDTIVEKQQAGTLRFDVVAFLENVVLADLNNSGSHPLLLGRCLCLGGQYAQQMPPEMTSRFLEATVNGLQENQPACIRISAVKAAYWFCDAFAEGTNGNKNILRSQLPSLFQGLFDLANQMSAEVLTLVLESFEILVSVDKAFTASIESKICPLTIAKCFKFPGDRKVLEVCKGIFRELTLNPECIGPLQTRLVLLLVNMMNVSRLDKTKEERVFALHVLQVLVRHSPQPYSNALIDITFPVSCHCVLNSNDKATLQRGTKVITTYLSVAPQQVMGHRDNDGQTGLHYILKIIAHLLNPQSSELAATYVGKLVTTLIEKAGNTLGENIDIPLKAVLSKMQRVSTQTVMQNLLMVYVHLVNTELEAVLKFLSTVPGTTGQSALAFVMSEWVDKQHLFSWRYDRKTATLALCKILEHGVTHDDSRLNEIIVEGDFIFSDRDDRVRTRSNARRKHWTKVPLLVKILKLIIKELYIVTKAVCACTQEIEKSVEDRDKDVPEEILDPGMEVNFIEDPNEDYSEDEDPHDDDDPKVEVPEFKSDSDDDDPKADVPDDDDSVDKDPHDDDPKVEDPDKDDPKAEVPEFKSDSDEEDPEFTSDSEDEEPEFENEPVYRVNLKKYLRNFLLKFSTHHCFPGFYQHLNVPERRLLTSLSISPAFS